MLAHCGHGDMWRDNMTTSTAEDFYDSIDGAMTMEQAAMALAMAEQGDTGSKPDNGGAPTTTTAPENNGDGKADDKPQDGAAPDAAGVPEDKLTADNAVILAKDGKHTIPFDYLEKARQQRDEFRAQAEAAQRQLAELQAQAQARADAGEAPTKTDNMVAKAEAAIEAGVDASLFGDFSEEALAKGIQHLVALQVRTEVAKAIEPIQTKHQQDARSEHENFIYKAHPNADSIVQSEQFKAWVDAHPSAVRNALWQTFDTEKGGTAAEIVEVLDAYDKAVKASASPPHAAKDTKAAALAAAKDAPVDAPNSLTSIPGGRADGATPNERMAELSGPDLYAALEGKTPAQIEAFLNQQL